MRGESPSASRSDREESRARERPEARADPAVRPGLPPRPRDPPGVQRLDFHPAPRDENAGVTRIQVPIAHRTS